MKKHLLSEIASFKVEMDSFPWESQRAYADWVSQTYYFVSETTTLLSLAAAKSEKNSKLQLRFIEHASEEKAHDKLLLMDLKGAGCQLEDYPELSATSSFYQAQYFWIQQRDPRIFFGYIILLEGLAALHGPEMNKRAEAAHGKSATHFLRIHSSEDIDHIEKALDEVSKFPSEVAAGVLRNFQQASECYRWMLRSIQERQTRMKATAA